MVGRRKGESLTWGVGEDGGAWADLGCLAQLAASPPSRNLPCPRPGVHRGARQGAMRAPAHLHIHEELPEVSGGQHNGGVELNNIALVQGDVMVGGEALGGKSGQVRLCRQGPGPGGLGGPWPAEIPAYCASRRCPRCLLPTSPVSAGAPPRYMRNTKCPVPQLSEGLISCGPRAGVCGRQ